MASDLLLKNKEKNLLQPYFVYAPPNFGDPNFPYRQPKAPYAQAKDWMCSVYYYWWMYLRRNEEYRRTCEQGGTGQCAKLYHDFGNIYETDFQSWWSEHWELFAEPIAIIAGDDAAAKFKRSITLKIDLDAKRSRLIDEVRNLLTELQSDNEQDRIISGARYQVETNPLLSGLHQHLAVWDMKQLNPWVSDAVLADLADIRVNHVVNGSTAEQARVRFDDREVARITSEVKRRKTQAVQRHLRIAAQYIEHAGHGRFPLSLGR